MAMSMSLLSHWPHWPWMHLQPTMCHLSGNTDNWLLYHYNKNRLFSPHFNGCLEATFTFRVEKNSHFIVHVSYFQNQSQEIEWHLDKLIIYMSFTHQYPSITMGISVPRDITDNIIMYFQYLSFYYWLNKILKIARLALQTHTRHHASKMHI